jgi:hypothetical protein
MAKQLKHESNTEVDIKVEFANVAKDKIAN